MTHTYHISGMTCSGCAAMVEKALLAVDGVQSVKVDLQDSKATISMAHHIPFEKLQEGMANLHYQISEHDHTDKHEHTGAHRHHHPQQNKDIHEEGQQYYCPMLCEGDKKYPKPGNCPVCGMHLVKEQKFTPSAIEYTCPMHPEIIRNEPGSCPICGMDLVPKTVQKNDDEEEIAYRSMLRKFWIATVFTLPILLMAMGEMTGIHFSSLVSKTTLGWLQFILSLPVLYVCAEFFKRGYQSVIRRSPNMWTLIMLGVGAAYLFSMIGLLMPNIFPHQFKMDGAVHLYFEAATVILSLVLLGQVMETKARSKTNSAIRELLNLVPPETTVVREGKEVRVPLEHVKINDVIKIKPGEKIPVDGKVLHGKSAVNESMITGEAFAVEKNAGDLVTGGTLNETGSFEMVALRIGSETLLAQIIDMVNKASRSKAPIQNFADKVSRYFVPAVVLVAVLSFIVWAVWGPEPSLVYAFANAVTVLIIACPCALGLATPMSIMVGTGKGAQLGVLVKEAKVIEEMEKANILVIDKTGTITEGKPSLKFVQPVSGLFSENEILQYAASLEASSEHPLAKAIGRGATIKNITTSKVDHFESITGYGVTGTINSKKVAIGNLKLVEKMGLSIDSTHIKKIGENQSRGETVMFVIIDEQVAGYITVADPIKPTSKSAIHELQKQGLKVYMLSGDNKNTAKHVADELGLDGFEGECLPADKLNKIQELQQKNNIVVMAGDGINDAPALAQANIGIAMGTGTDAAIQSAGVTLVKGDLLGIIRAKKLSADVMTNIRQNLFLAFIYNSIGVPIAAGVLFPFTGMLLSPMLAALAMSLSSVSVIVNSLRIRTK